jgi:hypothetical protein
MQWGDHTEEWNINQGSTFSLFRKFSETTSQHRKTKGINGFDIGGDDMLLLATIWVTGDKLLFGEVD